jgi:glycosyltransferase involved in cell wall biosynthesis
MPYKVIFVVTSLIIGGAERQLVQILKHLSRKYFEPVVVCLKDPGVLAEELAPLNITIYSRLLNHKADFRVLPRLMAIIKKEKPHILWARGIGDKMFWGRLAGKLTRIPIILSSIHFMGSMGQRKSIIGPFNKILTPLTDRFVAVSENQRRYLIEEEGIPAHKTVVIHNGIDLGGFRAKRGPWSVKEDLGIPDRVAVIGQVARLRPEKGHRLLLQAAHKLQEKDREVVILLIGDGPERKILEEICTTLHLGSMVRFLGDQREPADLINILDMGTLSSPMETFPNVLLEYMALAKPVIAPNAGGVPEIITDGIHGLLFSPGQADSLAEKILFLLANPEVSRAMGEEGAKRVANSFSLEMSLKKIEQLFFELLAEKGRL